MKDLTVSFDNFCQHGKTNINAQILVCTQTEVVIGIQCSFVSKHYPFKPFKLTELAYVGGLSRNNSFRDFPIQFVNAEYRIEPCIGLKFEAVILKFLWHNRLHELSVGTFLQFPFLSLGISPWGELLSLSFMT